DVQVVERPGARTSGAGARLGRGSVAVLVAALLHGLSAFRRKVAASAADDDIRRARSNLDIAPGAVAGDVRRRVAQHVAPAKILDDAPILIAQLRHLYGKIRLPARQARQPLEGR